MLDRVVCSCLQVGVMLVNKYAKYESNMSRDNENKWGSTKTLTFAAYSKWKRGHNYDKMLDRVVCSCLQVGVMLVNKYAKYESNMSRDNENKWGSTKTLTFAAYSKWKRGHNYDKMLDRVVCSCLQVGVMLVNKYAKYESNMSRDKENIWGSTKTLTFARRR